MKPNEPTYQVALDALAFTTCYHAFLITAEVPVIYMHQFWAIVTKHKSSYRFKIDNKKFSMNVEVFRDILNIRPRIQGQEFDEPPTKEEALSFIRELGHFREIKYITNVIVDNLHQPWRTFASIINKCLCGKVSGIDKIRLYRFQILYGLYYKKNLDFVALIWKDLAYQIDNMDSKKQDKMFYLRFTKIIIHHFLDKDKSISIRNRMFMHTARDDSLLGTMRFLSKHADTQLRKSLKKSYSAISSEESPSKKKSTKAKKVAATKTKPTKKKASVKADRGKGDGINFESRVPDEQYLKTTSADEGTGDSGEEDKDDENDSEYKCDDDDDDDDDDDNLEEEEEKIDDEEIMDEEEDDEVTKELYKDVNVNLGNKDADMTDDDQGGADQQNSSQQSGFKQEEKDAHVTLTPVYDTQKTVGPMQSSSISSDFTSKLLNLENVSPYVNEIASLMDTATIPPPPPFFNPLSQQATPTPTPTTFKATTTIPVLSDFSFVFRFNDRVTNLEKDLLEINQVDHLRLCNSCDRENVTESLEAAVLARSSAQPNSTYKAAALLSEFELTKILIDKMEKNKSYDKDDYKRELYNALVKSYPTDKDLFDTYGVQQDQEFDAGDNDEQPADNEVSKTNWFKNPKQPLTSNSDWNKRQQVDSRPPQTWISQVTPAKEPITSFDELIDTLFDFFAFSLTELEYHLEECSKATTERIDWHNPKAKQYSFDVSKPLSLIRDHRGRQVFPWYFFINNDLEYLKGRDLSRRKRIIAVTRLTIMKKYDYGHLKEIEVRREDQKLYKFREGDFLRLRLQDIEDMLLLLVQKKLTNLIIDERYDLNVALCQISGIRPHTLHIPKRVIYKDQNDRNKLMCAVELYKFSDGMLNVVQTALNDIDKGIRMEYLPKRKWSGLDKRRAQVMV
nr:hypothetical protein [Tanacetum cinerariifolium]